MSALKQLYAPISPYDCGMLDVGDGHAFSEPGILHHLIEANDRFAGKEP